MADYVSPEARRRIATGLMAAQYAENPPTAPMGYDWNAAPLSPSLMNFAAQRGQPGVIQKTLGLIPGFDQDGKRGAQSWGNALMSTAQFPIDAVAGMGQAITAPARAYRGEFDPTSEEGVGEALNVAGNAMMGGLAAPKPAGNAVGIFGGRLAKTADQAALARAEELAAKGAPREQIWNDTGWFQGPDKKWRFEINDQKSPYWGPSAAELGGDGTANGPISQWFRHRELFDAYPDLKAHRLNVGLPDHTNPNLPRSPGAFDENGGVFAQVGGKHDPRSAILHELQHGVQGVEGFSSGGSPSRFTKAELEAERARLGSVSDNGWSSVSNYDPSVSDRQIAVGLYNRLGGEAEARTVQSRMDLTADQRRARAPWLDYDVPEANQIVRFDTAGPQMSLGAAGGDLKGAALGAIPDQGALMDRTRSRFGSVPPRDPFSNPENGRPFTGSGWHGSPDNELAVGSAVDRADPSAYMSPHGPWITNNRDVASTYTRVEPEAPLFSGSNVMPMEARFRNPMIYDAQGRSGGEAYVAPGNVAWDTNDISAVAKQRGYDGLVVRNVRDELQGGGALSDVYHPLQRGTVYSPTTGDLLYANGGRPGAATGAALGAIPDTPGIRAYHGSPHDFDKFDLSKIGTGEGAQAYGHGLYFAENEGVAQTYKGAGPKQQWSSLDPPKVDGKMYEVNINANPSDFLDWDKPLSQQSEHIRKSMTDLANGEILSDWNGMQAYRSVGSQMMENLDLMSPELAQRVKGAGIPGVKYLDQGSRTGLGEGTSNYVVFDDKLIEILRKYGLLGMAGGAAAAEYSAGNSLMPSRPASPKYRPGDA